MVSAAPFRRIPRAAWFGLATALVFVVSVRHHWFIGDDAYISFRYAQHLLDGHGLVFNPGERVEGYTNFSWVLLMAAGMAAGLHPEPLSLWLGAACGAGVLAIVAWWGSRSVGWDSPWAWAAPLSLAANRTFGAWSTGGLETQMFTLLVVAGLATFFAEDERPRGRAWLPGLLFALAALTRPEGVLFFGLVGVAMAWRVARGHTAARSLVLYALAFAPIVGAHEAWRLAYYGAPLPNTFYAKVSGAWWSQGFAYLGFFGRLHLAPWPLLLAAVGLWRAPRFDMAVTAGVAATWCAYLAYVGGDRFEFRLLEHALPLLYVLAQHGLAATADALTARGRALPVLAGLALIATAFAPTVLTPGSTYPKGVNSLENIGAYAERRGKEGRALARLVDRGFLDPDTVVAVTGAGALPYFAGLPTVDIHGLNDATIARQPITERGEIGHEKYASPAYLAERDVAIWDVRNYTVQLHRNACPEEPPHHESPHYTGPLRCVVGGGYALVFATTLPEDEFRRRFARFEIVY